MIEKVRDQEKRVWYGEVLILKDDKIFTGFAQADTKAEARKKLYKSVRNKFGNKKFKYLQLWDLPGEMDVEVEK